MFQYLSISNFRNLSNVKVKPLNRVNLIAGSNDVGKTAILEAIYLLFSSSKVNEFSTVFRQGLHDRENADFWFWLFPEKDLKKTIQVEIGQTDGQGENWIYRTSLRIDTPTGPADQASFLISYDKVGPNKTTQNLGQWSGQPGSGWSGVGGVVHPAVSTFSTNDLAPDNVAEAFNEVAKLKDGEVKMESRMRHLEPRLKRLRYLRTRNSPEVYADLGFSEMVPVTQFGSAFYRLLTIFSGTLANKSKILLIDEIENSLHHSTFQELWTEFAKIAEEEEIQIFATTHSEECIRAAHETMSRRKSYDLAVHRIQRLKNGTTEVISHSREMLDAAFDTGLPIR